MRVNSKPTWDVEDKKLCSGKRFIISITKEEVKGLGPEIGEERASEISKGLTSRDNGRILRALAMIADVINERELEAIRARAVKPKLKQGMGYI